MTQAGQKAPYVRVDSTYHYHDGLVFSREKMRYPFVRAHEIPPIKIPLISDIPLTYPKLYQLVSRLPGAGGHQTVADLSKRLWKLPRLQAQKYFSMIQQHVSSSEIKTTLDLEEIPEEATRWIKICFDKDLSLEENMIFIKKRLKTLNIHIRSGHIQSLIRTLLEENN